jgi:serralysin
VAALAMFALSAPSIAAPVVELEPNDTFGDAQNLDLFFTLGTDENVQDVTLVPSVTVTGLPSNSLLGVPGSNTFDYFRFTVANAGTVGTFDIDAARDLGSDLALRLFNSSFTSIAFSDDASAIDLGSTSRNDPFFTYTFANAGTYFLRVGQFNTATQMDEPQALGLGYALNISLAPSSTAAVPEPATWAMMLLGFGAVGYSMRRRKVGYKALQAI